MIEVDSFEQARALSRAELEVLRASPRPEQRLWALWALALELTTTLPPLSLATEPDPGVRRHLAVVLAGYGEHALLLELAEVDPSPLVRASALGLVVRIAASKPDDRMRRVIEAAARGEPALRIAVLGAIPARAPAYQLDLATAALADPDRELQAEACEALLRHATPGALAAARGWLRAQPDPASHVERWLRNADVLALAETLADLAPPVRGAVLAKLRSPPWPAVERLLGEDVELLRALLPRTEIKIPARTLASAILRGAERGCAERLTGQLELATAGRAVLAELRAALLAGDVEDRLPALRREVDQLARALDVPDRAALLSELADVHPIEQGMALEHAVVRWLAERAPAPELDGLLAELEHHVAQRIAVMRASGAARRPPQGYAELGDDQGVQARYTLFRELEALQRALAAFTART